MFANDRVILHCDANSFYASVETVENPNLKDKPVAVAGNPKLRTGIILTKNHKAKLCGVSTGEAIWQSKLKCPDLVCIAPRMWLYEKYSKKLQEIYYSYTDKVESFGIDECWLDVTGSLNLFGSGEAIAENIRSRVKEELHITVSIGVSFCKLFAKLGSDYKKPDAITCITRENYKEIVYPLPICAVIGIGRKIERRFHQMGIKTLGQIVDLNETVLKSRFGICGVRLKNTLLGRTEESVSSNIPLPKSVGNGTTTIKDIKNINEIRAVVRFLCDEIASRLRQVGLMAQRVHLSIRTADLCWRVSVADNLTIPSDSAYDLQQCAINILKQNWKFDESIRSLRICTTRLVATKDKYQLSFADILSEDSSLLQITEKKCLGQALDEIRTKYGFNSIGTASASCNNFLNGTIRI